MRKFILITLITLLFIPFSTFAQTKVITGKVVDENGVPVPLATVQQKGTSKAVTAGDNGTFSIPVSGKNPILEISSVNFNTQEFNIGSQSSYNVVLNRTGQLSEVVVTALGIKREKRSLGYASQSVNSEQLVESHQSNLLNALQGKVAGVTITSSGGGPGQGATINIRGINTINPDPNGLGTQPLFVIDGIPMDNSSSALGAGGGLPAAMANRASDINPDDIESVNILRRRCYCSLRAPRGEWRGSNYDQISKNRYS
ncbi:MAG: TonB-dependent receptor [Bacteroidota bacterium]|nr:TonB-dependent receptor [Bacteroidota bacterium]